MKFRLEIRGLLFIGILQFIAFATLNAQSKKYLNGQIKALESTLLRHFSNNSITDEPFSSDKAKVVQLQRVLSDSINELKLSVTRFRNSIPQQSEDKVKTNSLIKENEILMQLLSRTQDSVRVLNDRLNLCENRSELMLRKLDVIELKNEKFEDQIKTVEKLIEELKPGKETKLYKVTKMREREIVLGKRGLYFAIDFKDPKAEQTLFFEEGLYYIDIFDMKYHEALSEFDRDVLRIIRNSRKEYEIFVRGSADLSNADFRKNLHKYYKFNSINFLKRSENEVQYEYTESEEKINESYSNKNLPNLRAQFIVNQMNESDEVTYPKTRLHILDGTVTQKFNPNDRNVRVYLYIKE